jgi:hypothetical protein
MHDAIVTKSGMAANVENLLPAEGKDTSHEHSPFSIFY